MLGLYADIEDSPKRCCESPVDNDYFECYVGAKDGLTDCCVWIISCAEIAFTSDLPYTLLGKSKA